MLAYNAAIVQDKTGISDVAAVGGGNSFIIRHVRIIEPLENNNTLFVFRKQAALSVCASGEQSLCCVALACVEWGWGGFVKIPTPFRSTIDQHGEGLSIWD